MRANQALECILLSHATSVGTFASCIVLNMPSIRDLGRPQFCADIEPGHSRAIECLEKHREEPGFNAACKADVEDLLAARIKDFRLDPQLKRMCNVDIDVSLCYAAAMLDACYTTPLVLARVARLQSLQSRLLRGTHRTDKYVGRVCCR